MADQHEAYFIWPSTDPAEVILTGSFDEWKHSIHLHKTSSGFEGTVKIPWGTRAPYKFIVDGQWQLDGQPTEPDRDGNINNVYTAPPKPSAIHGTDKQPQSSATSASVVILPTSVNNATTTDGTTTGITSDTSDTIENAVSADPIDPEKIPTAKPQEITECPLTYSKVIPIEVASDVPIGIVSVNANTEIKPALNNGLSTEQEAPTTQTPAVPAAGADITLPADPPTLAPVPEAANPATPIPSSASGHSDEKLSTNGTVHASTNGTTVDQTPKASIPSTPTKAKPSPLSTPTKKQVFPSSGSSPTSSRFTDGSTTSRKKKRSIFGKIKHMFDKDHEKGDEKKGQSPLHH